MFKKKYLFFFTSKKIQRIGSVYLLAPRILFLTFLCKFISPNVYNIHRVIRRKSYGLKFKYMKNSTIWKTHTGSWKLWKLLIQQLFAIVFETGTQNVRYEIQKYYFSIIREIFNRHRHLKNTLTIFHTLRISFTYAVSFILFARSKCQKPTINVHNFHYTSSLLSFCPLSRTCGTYNFIFSLNSSCTINQNSWFH